MYDLCDLAHVAGWDKYNLHDLAQVSWVGSVLIGDPAQPLTTAGEALDDLDHDLSDLSVRGVNYFTMIITAVSECRPHEASRASGCSFRRGYDAF